MAVADLCRAMTWPIDMAEELDDGGGDDLPAIDYTKLLHSLTYKAPPPQRPPYPLLPPPPPIPHLTRHPNHPLTPVRNLLFIRDPPSHSLHDPELSGLQGTLIKALEQSKFLELIW
jgi:replication fork protection complex subunit Tof1/Swi1